MARSSIARRDVVVDVAVAVAFVGLSGLLVLGVVDRPGDRAAAAAIAAAHVAPLCVRRVWPLGVVGAMTLTAVLSVPLGVPVVVLGPSVTVALFTVGAKTQPRVGRPVLAAVVVVMAGVVVANGGDAGTVVTNAVALAVAWWLGDRTRRSAAEVEAQRAAAAEASRRAAFEERLRIARELHDVVAHAMSVIAVQAGSGRFVIDSDPDVARATLANIETTSREALQEMRRLLSVLRAEGSIDGDLEPAPGLGDVEDLATSTAAAGVSVEVVVHGEPFPLPSGLDLSAYRVVQEALTNVRRHAEATVAVVEIGYSPSCLTVRVCDDGVGPRAGTGLPGHGLVGMRERVALYGGTLDAGTSSSGGFHVVAQFPLAETS